MTKKEQEFARWIDEQDFAYFSGYEFIRYSRQVRRGVKNSIPPKRYWNRIIPTMRLLDALRARVGPIILTSTYRSPAYNAAVGGARYSQHKEFRAIDFVASRATPKQCYDTLLEWRRSGDWVGGLGLYSTFVHIDTRNYNATWGNV